ncbi:Uncharacterized protein APZ42_023371, partial [Daphnia magna]
IQEIPVRYPSCNLVTHLDEIDPLKVEIYELREKVGKFEILNESLTVIQEIPIRYPRCNLVTDLDDIDPLKVEIYELGEKVHKPEILNESLTSKIEENNKVEKELQLTIVDLKTQNQLLVQRSGVSTQSTQQPDRGAEKQESTLYEALGSSKGPVLCENEVAEEEEIDEFGLDIIQNNENLVEKKIGTKFKRWLVGTSVKNTKSHKTTKGLG